MTSVKIDNLISVSEAHRRGVSALVRDVEAGKEPVLMRNNRPVATLISIARMAELEQLKDDLHDVALASARMVTTSEHRHSLDQILDHFGVSRNQLRETD